MNYQVDGPEGAPWLIVSNSLATNLTMLDDQARELKHAYRVLRYDPRGHGGTEATAGRYSFDLLQLSKQLVVLTVRKLRTVEDVILVRRPVKRFPQFGCSRRRIRVARR